MSFDAGAQKHFRQTLFDPESTRTLIGPAATALGDGVATGMIVGGNLSLLSASVGAPDEFIPPDGSLVLLEDVNEEPYQVDRMLTQLLRSGWFTGVTGIVLGSWTGCGNLDGIRDVMMDLLVGLGIPVVWEFGFGHCPDQLTIPLGAEATLDADQGTLTLTEPALT
jgi:muramoyltetrapeptide carboxypeptidase